jgi:hypothetical protein
MSKSDRVELTHQALGEFVIVYQWVENLYRQIGWFILDPERSNWPPTQLRKESSNDLINKVTELFTNLVSRYSFPNGSEKSREMLELREQFHALRKYRNRVLHSTFIELKAGGEVHGYIRSNPDVGVDPETGELIFDQEDFSAENIYAKLREYGEHMFRLNMIHIQLIHWHPFGRYQHGA